MQVVSTKKSPGASSGTRFLDVAMTELPGARLILREGRALRTEGFAEQALHLVDAVDVHEPYSFRPLSPSLSR